MSLNIRSLIPTKQHSEQPLLHFIFETKNECSFMAQQNMHMWYFLSTINWFLLLVFEFNIKVNYLKKMLWKVTFIASRLCFSNDFCK